MKPIGKAKNGREHEPQHVTCDIAPPIEGSGLLEDTQDSLSDEDPPISLLRFAASKHVTGPDGLGPVHLHMCRP
jgi:hypothetical protein